MRCDLAERPVVCVGHASGHGLALWIEAGHGLADDFPRRVIGPFGDFVSAAENGGLRHPGDLISESRIVLVIDPALIGGTNRFNSESRLAFRIMAAKFGRNAKRCLADHVGFCVIHKLRIRQSTALGANRTTDPLEHTPFVFNSCLVDRGVSQRIENDPLAIFSVLNVNPVGVICMIGCDGHACFIVFIGCEPNAVFIGNSGQ